MPPVPVPRPGQATDCIERDSVRFVAVDSCEGGPHGEVNVVRALDVHWHAHGGRMRHEWMGRMACGCEDTGADRLLSEVGRSAPARSVAETEIFLWLAEWQLEFKVISL